MCANDTTIMIFKKEFLPLKIHNEIFRYGMTYLEFAAKYYGTEETDETRVPKNWDKLKLSV